MRVGLAIACAVACLPATATNREPLVRQIYIMGTRARLVTWAPDRRSALATLDRAVQVLEAADAELSTWRNDSAVSALNRQPVGRPYAVPPGLCDAFPALFEWHAATAGTFDPAIGRLTDAWGIHAEGRVPPAAILREARIESGLSLLAFDPARCEITRRAGATIDVGAFGKGDALDRVERALHDVPWMIDLGGQVSVHGLPPRSRGWTVDIAHPRERDRAFLQVELTGGSLSTSAGSERDLIVDGRRIGHILDPRTGAPAAFDGSVTVWHRRALEADILSTALFVMGPDAGSRWAARRDIAACFLEPQQDGSVRQIVTPAFRPLLVSS